VQNSSSTSRIEYIAKLSLDKATASIKVLGVVQTLSVSNS
jgi:hypothetical protein